MSEAIEVESGSFRDPDSRIFYDNGRVLRALSDRALQDWRHLSGTSLYDRLSAEGKVVGTQQIDDHRAWGHTTSELLVNECAGVLEHERIPFVSYPYEWPFAMLTDAARLQLDLLLSALDEGMTLKDSTPYNVQWRGARPVFVDVGSFERLREGRPWLGYRQFCMLFLYPLMLQAYKGVPFQPWLRGSLEGITPDAFRGVVSFRDLVRKGVFTHVYLHSKLEKREAGARRDVKSELKEAGFSADLIRANVNKVSKVIERLTWSPSKTEWSDYGAVNEYREQDVEDKSRFVDEAAAARRPNLLWDLGCNDGRYTRIAAAYARHTIAIDADAVLVNDLYESLRNEGDTSILTLTMDLADPSPGLGWRGAERKTLAERATPDLTLCLALLHHLSIAGNVPVRDYVEWLRELGTAVVIEFVTREDPMVKLLLSRKEEGSHPDYDRAFFERCLEDSFAIERRQAICDGRRLLYLAVPR